MLQRHPQDEESRRSALPAAVAVALLASSSLAAWLIEVLAVKGWAGLAWTRGFPLAAYPVCLFASVCALIPVLRRTRPPWWRIVAFLVAATGVFLVSFSITRDALLGMRWALMSSGIGDILRTWPLSIALTSAGLYALIRGLLTRVSPVLIPLVVVALALVIALSVATIQVFPAVNGDRDFIHAVKMGYPTFWVNVLLAAAVELALRQTARGAPVKPAQG